MTTVYEEPNAYLVAQIREGNRKAQYQIYQKYVQAMHYVCVRMIGKTEEAEEVLQDAFVRAFMRIDEYRGDAAFGAWLKRIVINTSINFLQKKKLNWTSLDEIYEEPNETPTYDSFNQEDYQLSHVKKAMQQLPDGFRIVLNLYLFEGYDHEEIGNILGITSSTSKSQYSRAKKKLRDLLKASN